MGRIVWARLADYHSSFHALTFLTPYPTRYKRHMRLKFGVKEVHCVTNQLVVQVADDLAESSYENPGILFVSTTLFKFLGIPPNLTFQLILEEDSIIIGPTIGLLLGTRLQNYTPEFMAEHYTDRMGVYEETGGLIVAYSTIAVDWERQFVKGLMYSPETRTWIPVETVIPKVTYRRHIFQPNFREFCMNIDQNNGILFNSIRCSKWRVHNILMKNPILKRYLPATILLDNYNQLFDFVNMFNQVILKPKSGSRGKGILVIKRVVIDNEEKFLLSDYRHIKAPEKTTVYSQESLLTFLDKLSIFGSSRYICQRYMDLETIDGCFFDIRLLMQKGFDMNWHCTGIECRIANPDKKITNLSAGGRAMPLDEAVRLLNHPVSVVKLYASLMRVCNEFCFWMDTKKNQHFAEFGIDLGLSQDGRVWLIEANFRPGYKGFLTFDRNLYLEIGYQPIRYATALQGFLLCRGSRFKT